MSAVVLAVDGGNSKTDLALVARGRRAARARARPAAAHRTTSAWTAASMCSTLLERRARGGHRAGGRAVADVAALLLAGVDFPDEEDELAAARRAARLGRARRIVANDTFAVLRAGTERGWGVAVVCGAGINCVGVAPDGRHARFPSLGAITGDWGGGYDVGLAALSAAARSEDGRGPKTSLEQSVPGALRPRDAAGARRGDPPGADPDARACSSSRRSSSPRRPTTRSPPEIVDRLADEVVALARVAARRGSISTDEPAEVAARRRAAAGHATRVCSARSTAALRDVGPRVDRPRRPTRRRSSARRCSRSTSSGRERRCEALDELRASRLDVRSGDLPRRDRRSTDG